MLLARTLVAAAGSLRCWIMYETMNEKIGETPEAGGVPGKNEDGLRRNRFDFD
jgi:hypothetical protein